VGRPAKFSTEEILDVTAQLVAAHGPSGATVAAIAGELGAPTGSIYHRFGSRDLVLARVWIRTVKEAQAGFLEAIRQEDVGAAAVDAALHVPRWCRENLDAARILLLYRREELVELWPDELGDDLAGLNAEMQAALGDFCARGYGNRSYETLGRVLFALVDVPYGAVRRHLVAGKPPPEEIDDLIRATCRCILDLPSVK
jgi:AcrR family transcriptional regulator